MKIDPALLTWLETELDRIAFGELGVLFHIRGGSIEWTEKIRRETVKRPCNPSVPVIDSNQKKIDGVPTE